jgi:hypothetical protein
MYNRRGCDPAHPEAEEIRRIRGTASRPTRSARARPAPSTGTPSGAFARKHGQGTIRCSIMTDGRWRLQTNLRVCRRLTLSSLWFNDDDVRARCRLAEDNMRHPQSAAEDEDSACGRHRTGDPGYTWEWFIEFIKHLFPEIGGFLH